MQETIHIKKSNKKKNIYWKRKMRNRMQQTNHYETQSSQKICLHRNCIGACIFSWQIAQRSPAAFTWIEILTA